MLVFPKLLKGQRFTKILTQKGYDVRNFNAKIEIINTIKNKEIQNLLRNSCYKITRTILLNEVPFIFSIGFYALKTNLKVKIELYLDSIYKEINNNGIFFHKFIDEFEAEIIRDENIIKNLKLTENSIILKRA